MAEKIDEKGSSQSGLHSPTNGLAVPTGPPTLRDLLQHARITRAREKHGEGVVQDEPHVNKTIHQEELDNARRALRTASWVSVFFLITTDILGPFNAPFAFSQVGYVPGAILYIVMGGMAAYTGLILAHLFFNLDSEVYPVKTYGDLGYLIFGKVFKRVCDVLQSLQLIINVGLICLSNAQAVEQIAASNRFCFSIAVLIWTLVGMVVGQIRSLKSYGWLANSAVWLNLIIIFTSMGFVSHSPPNFAGAKAAYGIDPGPIEKAAFVSLPLNAKVNGIMNMVFAYGGAMIFPEFLAEMRRPMDFWKGMACAQLLITVVYLMYGLFVYSFQGQFTLPLAFQGVSKQSWQDVGNVLGLITGLIAAGLYGNIGIKVAYYNIVEDWFNGPPLMSRKGRYIWTIMVVVYWAVAFVIASAIPQVQTISGLVAAVCIMQFTYTFPPLMLLGYKMRISANGLHKTDNAPIGEVPAQIQAEDPGDTWRDFSRWKRAFFGGNWLFNLFNLIIFLGGLTMACLGMYGSGLSIKEQFDSAGAATSFGCSAPV
ncbi:hypothetical protein K435DRAFT_758442 [Dendrothele bispora CBS 962.96]|uniref:Amino acid transporter transmembrane domain-containing protein n=1 Tax=Dendrothele bispora (strain CBS 962.96) TaxID=1314807 RepID=A0A4S8LRI3_DENBC|nr:hypothetical protein K435DRAFT_758442 [Dendrothele bispora CBS 962.96]